MTTPAILLMRARDHGLRLAVAESCTGGLLAAEITETAGASDIFECGYVTYSDRAKQDMLGVTAGTLRTHGAVSEAVATEMAEAALARADTDIALAITGIAGPGGSGTKPEGRVCFALARKGTATQAETVEFGALGRENVRRAATAHAMDMLGTAVG